MFYVLYVWWKKLNVQKDKNVWLVLYLVYFSGRQFVEWYSSQLKLRKMIEWYKQHINYLNFWYIIQSTTLQSARVFIYIIYLTGTVIKNSDNTGCSYRQLVFIPILPSASCHLSKRLAGYRLDPIWLHSLHSGTEGNRVISADIERAKSLTHRKWCFYNVCRSSARLWGDGGGLTVCPWNVLIGLSWPSLHTWMHMSVLQEANVLLLCQSTSRAGAVKSQQEEERKKTRWINNIELYVFCLCLTETRNDLAQKYPYCL